MFWQIIFTIIIFQSFSFFLIYMKINACFLLVKNTNKYLITGILLSYYDKRNFDQEGGRLEITSILNCIAY
jgi:hypothetical protein